MVAHIHEVGEIVAAEAGHQPRRRQRQALLSGEGDRGLPRGGGSGVSHGLDMGDEAAKAVPLSSVVDDRAQQVGLAALGRDPPPTLDRNGVMLGENEGVDPIAGKAEEHHVRDRPVRDVLEADDLIVALAGHDPLALR